jgi:undecaprenyl-diphosphatase
MDIVKAIVYGIVQGLTEFLPVSSTAHLRIVPALLGWGDAGAAFTAVIQLGTVAAVLIFFWKDLASAFKGFFGSIFGGSRDSVEARTGWAVFYATVLIIPVGLLLKDFVEGPWRSLWVIAGALIVNGFVMFACDKYFKKDRTIESVNAIDGVKIGLWQCLALIPGMSRSGSSIAGGLSLGFDRAASARLSFLMSVPAVTLAGLYGAYKERKNITGELLTPTIVAILVSFVVGYACIKWLIGFVQRHGITPFVSYRIVLGVIILILCATKTLKAEAPVEKKIVPKEIHVAS